MATITGTSYPQNIYISTSGGIVTPSGRTLYRHSSDEGSVLVLDFFGTTVNMFIADCKYRSYTCWCDHGTSLTTWGQIPLSYLKPSLSNNSETNDDEIILTDSELQAHSLISTYSGYPLAKDICDVWYANGNSTLTSFRGMTIGNMTGFDAPNIYEAIMFRIEGTYIDTLDKYRNDSNYNQFCFSPTYNNRGGWFLAGSRGYVWSCTKNSSYQYGIARGAFINAFMYSGSGIRAPIKEL